MSLTQFSTESDQCESLLDDNSAIASTSVLEPIYSLADLSLLAQKESLVDASGPHIVLTCGPYDEDED